MSNSHDLTLSLTAAVFTVLYFGSGLYLGGKYPNQRRLLFSAVAIGALCHFLFKVWKAFQ